MRRRLVLSAFVVVVAFLAGCGDDDGGDTDDTTSSTTADTSTTEPDDSDDSTTTAVDDDEDAFDTCGLLVAADLQAEFGSPFDDGEFTHQEQTGADQCVWSNTDAPPVKTFTITVYTEERLSEEFKDAGITVASLFRQNRDLAEQSGPVEDIGLGDEAYLAGTKLEVLIGDTSYSFSTFLGDSPEAIAGLRALADKVIKSD